jgi:aspartate kinase
MKFGGSSVANAERMCEVLNIVKHQKGRKLVVLSACQGITDKLEEAAYFAKNKEKNIFQSIFEDISQHHIDIVNQSIKNNKDEALVAVQNLLLSLRQLLDGIFLLQELTSASMDAIYSFGELLSTTIFHYICEEENIDNFWVDARKYIITDSNYNSASPIPELFADTVKEYFNEEINSELIVTQGFIAADEFNKTTTLGRGGSDLSASIIGAAIDAEEIQIWTDVDGVMTSDPQKYPNAKTVPEMSFSEIKDLSFWGAKVLHPKTILPAIQKNITIKVLNALNTMSEGTIITNFDRSDKFEIHSVLSKKNCQLLNVNIVFENDNSRFISIAQNSLIFSSSNGKFSAIIENNTLDEMLESIDTDCNTLSIEKVTVICVSGQNLNTNSTKLATFISYIGNCFGEIPINQIIFQHSNTSILFVINESQINDETLNEIISKIHTLIVNNFK